MSKDLIDALRSITKQNNDGFSKVCTVDSVDLTNLTCYCVPINGDADIQEVRLMANIDNGFLLIPEVDSVVVVSFLSDSSAKSLEFAAKEWIKENKYTGYRGEVETFGEPVMKHGDRIKLTSVDRKSVV